MKVLSWARISRVKSDRSCVQTKWRCSRHDLLRYWDSHGGRLVMDKLLWLLVVDYLLVLNDGLCLWNVLNLWGILDDLWRWWLGDDMLMNDLWWWWRWWSNHGNVHLDRLLLHDRHRCWLLLNDADWRSRREVGWSVSMLWFVGGSDLDGFWVGWTSVVGDRVDWGDGVRVLHERDAGLLDRHDFRLQDLLGGGDEERRLLHGDHGRRGLLVDDFLSRRKISGGHAWGRWGQISGGNSWGRWWKIGRSYAWWRKISLTNWLSNLYDFLWWWWRWWKISSGNLSWWGWWKISSRNLWWWWWRKISFLNHRLSHLLMISHLWWWKISLLLDKRSDWWHVRGGIFNSCTYINYYQSWHKKPPILHLSTLRLRNKLGWRCGSHRRGDDEWSSIGKTGRSRQLERLDVQSWWWSGEFVDNLNPAVLHEGRCIRSNGRSSRSMAMINMGPCMRIGHGGVEASIVRGIFHRSKGSVRIHDATYRKLLIETSSNRGFFLKKVKISCFSQNKTTTVVLR